MSTSHFQISFTVVKGPDHDLSGKLEEDQAQAVIGRGSKALPLTDPNVSKDHVKVFVDGGLVWIEDLGSRNGTFFKGEKVDRRKVQNLDEIEIGKTVLRFFILDDLSALKKRPQRKKKETTGSKSIKDLIQDELQQFSKWDLDEARDLDDVEAHVEPFLLRILTPEGEEYTRRVQKSMVAIGRTKTDIELSDPDVSRHHATLIYEGPKKVLLRDMGSTNGTWVNAKEIKEVSLKDRDRIQMGSTLLEVIFDE